MLYRSRSGREEGRGEEGRGGERKQKATTHIVSVTSQREGEGGGRKEEGRRHVFLFFFFFWRGSVGLWARPLESRDSSSYAQTCGLKGGGGRGYRGGGG